MLPVYSTPTSMSPQVALAMQHQPQLQHFVQPPFPATATQPVQAMQQSQVQQAIQTPTTMSTATPPMPSARQRRENMMAMTLPLFPRPNFQPTLWANPRPRLIALHEAYLSYHTVPLDAEGNPDDSIELFQYFEYFVQRPKKLDPEEPSFVWSFDITPEQASKLPTLAKNGPVSGIAYWGLIDGSKQYQLRCVKDPKSRLIPPHRWTVSETAWPEFMYVSVNGIELQARRKIHHGRDLPINVTQYLVQGQNQIRISVLHDPPSKKKNAPPPPQFYIALESIDTADAKRARRMIRPLSLTASLSEIQRRLATMPADDDDLCLVDEDMTIDLVDPYTAQVFGTPVRGTSCSHRECFDLDTFLATRLMCVRSGSKEKMADGEGMSEEWKCPICAQDARP
ncbi:hypothetical protein KEM55_000164, partial [Ascosphaera atra]